MKIRVLAVGKIAPHFLEAQEHYLKRLPFVEVVELRKRKTPDEEGRDILKKVKGYFVVLDERGREVTSREFSKLLENHSTVTFVVGGADGTSESVKRKADFVLSLSKLTLQHDVARIVLLEQIFRGVSIIRGSPYHRD